MQAPQRAMDAASRDSREFVYELKFYVGNHQAETLKSWVRHRLQPDPHGSGPHADTYRVSSLYFDTQGFDVLARHGSYARSKYRVRRYDEGDVLYLERKTRGQYRVFKRRSPAALALLRRLGEAQAAQDWDGRWFHRRLLARRLQAVSRVDYQRLARIGHSDFGPVRLTLDQDLRAWRTDGLSFEVASRGTPLSTQQLILELKFGHAMPLVFKELIREFSPRLEGISKYRLACLELGLAPPSLAAEPVPAPLDPAMSALRADQGNGEGSGSAASNGSAASHGNGSGTSAGTGGANGNGLARGAGITHPAGVACAPGPTPLRRSAS
jgi:uncharacterized membrane protein YgcG